MRSERGEGWEREKESIRGVEKVNLLVVKEPLTLQNNPLSKKNPLTACTLFTGILTPSGIKLVEVSFGIFQNVTGRKDLKIPLPRNELFSVPITYRLASKSLLLSRQIETWTCKNLSGHTFDVH